MAITLVHEEVIGEVADADPRQFIQGDAIHRVGNVALPISPSAMAHHARPETHSSRSLKTLKHAVSEPRRDVYKCEL